MTGLCLETLNAILQVKRNFSITCEEFLNNISQNDELLKKVDISLEKYEWLYIIFICYVEVLILSMVYNRFTYVMIIK